MSDVVPSGGGGEQIEKTSREQYSKKGRNQGWTFDGRGGEPK